MLCGREDYLGWERGSESCEECESSRMKPSVLYANQRLMIFKKEITADMVEAKGDRREDN